MTLHRKQEGFTIVELLIVIVVIGILAALVVTTFTGIQQKARDTERQTDIKAIHGQLEAYYAQNGSYPALAQVNDATWRSTNMKGLDSEALKDPKGASAALAATVSSTAYGYAATPGTCTTAAADCTGYSLEADLEGSGTNYSKTNLN
jgi:prepilin-type N-terminal cleavage/methylation domain-containing protein